MGTAVLWSAARHRPRRAMVRLGALALGLWLAGFAMLVPVGPGARAALQPGLAPLVDEGLALGGVVSHPLALDPRAALQGQALTGALLLVAFATCLVIRSRQPGLRLATVASATASGVVLLALAHRLVGADAIYVWSGVPAWARDPFFAPFVNPNHAGIFLATALPLALVLALRSTESSRLLGILSFLLAAAGIWGTRSRGGLVVGAVAMAAMALLMGSRPIRLFILGAAGLALVGVAFNGPVETVADLSDAILPGSYAQDPLGQRRAIWADAMELLRGAPWVGLGGGGFAAAYPTVKSLPTFSSTAHAHQELIQVGVEHGVVIGLGWVVLLLAPLALGVRYSIVHEPGRRRDIGAATTAAYAALCLSGLWDFPFRIGALALHGALLGGALVGLAQGEIGARSSARGRLAWASTGALSLLATGAAAILALPGGGAGVFRSGAPDLAEANTLVKQAEVGRPASAAIVGAKAERLARGELARNPLSTKAMLLLARAARAQGRTEQAVEITGLAVQVAPTLPWPWVWRARILSQAEQPEGAQEAWTKALSLDLPDRETSTALVREALASADPDPGVAALAVIPPRADRLAMAGQVVAEVGDIAVAELLYAQALDADRKAALAWSAQLLRWGRAEEALAVLEGWPPDHCGAQKARGNALLALDRPTDAEAAWRIARARCPATDRSARVGLARALAAQGSDEGIDLLEALVLEDGSDADLRRILIRTLRREHRSEAMIPQLQALVDQGVATEGERRMLERLEVGTPSWQLEAEPPGEGMAP